jgi:hypothetical protein
MYSSTSPRNLAASPDCARVKGRRKVHHDRAPKCAPPHSGFGGVDHPLAVTSAASLDREAEEVETLADMGDAGIFARQAQPERGDHPLGLPTSASAWRRPPATMTTR